MADASQTAVSYDIRITKSGDGATVAAAELAKVASSANTATAALGQNTQALAASSAAHTAQSSTAREATTTQGNLASVIGSSAARWLTVGSAITAAVGYIRSSISAAIDHERVVNTLNGTLRATGQFTDATSASIIKLSKGLADGTKFTNEAVIGVNSLLLSFGAAEKDLPRLTAAVLDLSAGMGIDLHTAAMAVGKALEGSFGTLQRYGVQTEKGASLTDNLNKAITELEARFGGLRTAAQGTPVGIFDQMSKDAHQMSVEIGSALLPALAEVITALKGMKSLFGELITDTQRLGNSIASSGIGDILGELVSPIANGRAAYLANREDKAAAGDTAATFAKAKTSAMGLSDEVAKRMVNGELDEKTALGLNDTIKIAIDSGDLQKALDAIKQVRSALYATNPSEDIFGPQLPAPGSAGAAQIERNINSLNAGGNASATASDIISPAQTALDEERKHALEEITALQEKLNDETLEGYAREDAKALDTYQKRVQQINDLATKANLSPAQRTDLQAQNFDALQVTQAEISGKQQEEVAREVAEIKASIGRKTHQDLKDFEDQLTLDNIGNMHSRVQVAEEEYQARKAEYDKLLADGRLTEDQYTEYVKQAGVKRATVNAQVAAQFGKDLQNLGKQSIDQFGAGLSNTIVQGFRTGKFEMQKFFSDFFAFVAQAIIQLLIVKALQSTFLGLSGGGTASNASVPDTTGSLTGEKDGGINYAANGVLMPSAGSAHGEASGGMTLAADGYSSAGIGGVGLLTKPTVFPKFNVLAGEAGPEMLTVLSRPKIGSVAGVRAAMGTVKGVEMSVLPTASLEKIASQRAADGVTTFSGSSSPSSLLGSGTAAGPATGGVATIQITLSPELKAQIIQQAITGAVVQVNSDLRRDTPLSANVRQAVKT